MSFYYGSNQPPENDPSKSSWGDIFAIIVAVFKTLALPLGILFGAVFGLVALIYVFTINGWLGLAVIVLIVGAVIARGVWEAKHPPVLL